jgi:hypothetical protein
MSKMGEIFLEKSVDFERLHETSMKWNEDIWKALLTREERFKGRIDFSHEYIYWYENYVSLMAARNILDQFGEKYEILSDEAMGQFCMTSTFQSLEWLS